MCASYWLKLEHCLSACWRLQSPILPASMLMDLWSHWLVTGFLNWKHGSDLILAGTLIKFCDVINICDFFWEGGSFEYFLFFLSVLLKPTVLQPLFAADLWCPKTFFTPQSSFTTRFLFILVWRKHSGEFIQNFRLNGTETACIVRVDYLLD